MQSNLDYATAAFMLDIYGHVSEKIKQDRADRMQSYTQNTVYGKILEILKESNAKEKS